MRNFFEKNADTVIVYSFGILMLVASLMVCYILVSGD